MNRRDILLLLASMAQVNQSITTSYAESATADLYPLDKQLKLSDVDMQFPKGSKLAPQAFKAIAFYYPSWHRSGSRRSEWELLQAARPLNVYDKQPIIPSWGYYDNSNATGAYREIDAAANARIYAFFTYFYYDNGRVILDDQLRNGLLKAKNSLEIKFALAWTSYFRFRPVDYNSYDYAEMMDYVIANFISRPNYETINGVPIFGLTEVPAMIKAVGAIKLQKILEFMRTRVKSAGYGGLYFIACQNHHSQMRDIGIDGATNFQTFDSGHPGPISFAEAAIRAMKVWKDKSASLDVPYFPDCPVGWNNSPRLQNNPEKLFLVVNRDSRQYEVFLEAAKRYLEEHSISPKWIFLSSFNEWTEGHFLLPDKTFDDSYLLSVKKEF